MAEKCELKYPEGMIRAQFVKREKRFTVVARKDGRELLAHTNNTGSMMGLLRPGTTLLLSPAENPNRKLKWTLEAVELPDTLVGVNTAVPNRMLRRAFETGGIPELCGYENFRAEARVGQSRLDGLLTGPQGELWVECKNVTLVEDCMAAFPDARTERGQKHLVELMELSATGARVALLFLVQRTDGKCFGPADYIDPDYARLLAEAAAAGVEIWPHVAHVSEGGIVLGERLPVVLA